MAVSRRNEKKIVCFINVLLTEPKAMVISHPRISGHFSGGNGISSHVPSKLLSWCCGPPPYLAVSTGWAGVRVRGDSCAQYRTSFLDIWVGCDL